MIAFLAAYIIFLVVIHCFAYDSITASVGIEDPSTGGGMDFGRIKPGKASFTKNLPVLNPSTMPVKGIIFGRGQIGPYLTRKTFELGPGKSKSMSLQAVAPNETKNGSYAGDVMVYSSPFWIIYPDEFIQFLSDLNADAAVFCLDVLTSLVLTFITMSLLVSITAIGKIYTIWSIDLSWRRASRLILKKGW